MRAGLTPGSRLSWDTIACVLSPQASSWQVVLRKHFKRVTVEAAKHLNVKASITSPLGWVMECPDSW